MFVADGVSSRDNKNGQKTIFSKRVKKFDAQTASRSIYRCSNFLFCVVFLKIILSFSYPILKIIKKIESSFALFKPTIIITHFYNDLNVDHQIVNKATVTACRPQGAKIFPKNFSFEIPFQAQNGKLKEIKSYLILIGLKM